MKRYKAYFYAVVLVIILISIFKYNNMSTCEDVFHNKKKHHMDPVLNIKIKNKTFFKKIKNNILSNNINIDTNASLKLYINDEKRKITLIVNHSQSGGNAIVTMLNNILMIPNCNLNANKPQQITNIIYDVKNYRNIINKPNSLIHNNKLEYYNYTKKYSIKNIPDYNHNVFLIYNVLKDLYECLNINTPLKVLLPFPFEYSKNIINNVGIMLILFEKNMTLENFNNIFIKNKNMIYTSNHILKYKLHRFLPTSCNIRSNVDVVLSQFDNKIDENISINWGIRIIPKEPIYVAVYNKISSKTLTSNITYSCATDQFTPNKNMKSYNLL